MFDADFGVLSIGEEAKVSVGPLDHDVQRIGRRAVLTSTPLEQILGAVSNSQELLVVLNYLRGRRFT